MSAFDRQREIFTVLFQSCRRRLITGPVAFGPFQSNCRNLNHLTFKNVSIKTYISVLLHEQGVCVWGGHSSFLGGQMRLTSLWVWECSWRDYPVQHTSSVSTSQQASPCVVCVCVYSIISSAGGGRSCGLKPTWNFLNKSLICKVLEGVSSMSLSSVYVHIIQPLAPIQSNVGVKCVHSIIQYDLNVMLQCFTKFGTMATEICSLSVTPVLLMLWSLAHSRCSSFFKGLESKNKTANILQVSIYGWVGKTHSIHLTTTS